MKTLTCTVKSDLVYIDYYFVYKKKRKKNEKEKKNYDFCALVQQDVSSKLRFSFFNPAFALAKPSSAFHPRIGFDASVNSDEFRQKYKHSPASLGVNLE